MTQMTGGGVKERERREERVEKLGFFKRLRSDKKEVVLEEESLTGVHMTRAAMLTVFTHTVIIKT